MWNVVPHLEWTHEKVPDEEVIEVKKDQWAKEDEQAHYKIVFFNTYIILADT